MLEPEVARPPVGQVLRVGSVEGLELPVPAGEQQSAAPEPRDRPGPDLGTALERLAEHREVQGERADAERGRLACQARDHQLDETVVGTRVPSHQVQRQPRPSPRHEAEETAQAALGVVRLDQHARAVQRVREAAERHREAALVAAVPTPVTRGLVERCEVGVAQRRVPYDGGGVAAAPQARDRLAHRLHGRVAEREGARVDDGLVADLEHREAGVGERVRAGPAGADRRERPAVGAGVVPPPLDRRGPAVGVANRIAAGQADRADHPVGDAGPCAGRRSPCPRRPTCRAGSRSSPGSRGRRSPGAASAPAPRRRPRASGCPWVRGRGAPRR